MNRVFALVALLLIAAPQSSFMECTEAEKASIEAFLKAWDDAGRRGDRAFLEKVYASNYVAHGPAGPIDRATTITNTMRDAARNRANPQPAAVPDEYTITCTANGATITQRGTLPADAGGGFGRGTSHDLEKGKGDNVWKLVKTYWDLGSNKKA